MKELSIFVVALLAFTALAWGEEDKPIVNETFDKYDVGREPDGWTAVKGANSKIEVAEFKGERCLYVKMSPGEITGMSRTVDPIQKGVFTVEYDLYIKSVSSAGFEFLYIMSTATASGDAGSGNFNGVCVAMNSPGVLDYNNGGNWMSGPKLKEGQWYHFRYQIDMDKSGWDLYLDEKKVDKDIGFRGDIRGKLDLVYVANVWGAGSPNCELYFDNIRVYPGTEWKWTPVELSGKLPLLWGEVKSSGR